MPNTHRRRRRDSTVELSRVGVASAVCIGQNIEINYTVGHKKRDTFISSITQTNIDRFSYFFTAVYNSELRNKNLLKFSPHLKSVAALPCET